MDNGLLENGIGEVSDLDGDGLSALNYMPNANTPLMIVLLKYLDVQIHRQTATMQKTQCR